jgi:uncharacterized protein YcfJ
MKSRKNPPGRADYLGQAAGGILGAVAGAALGTTGGAPGVALGGMAGAIGGWWIGRAIAEALESRRRRASGAQDRPAS